jgi:hypothetical protein
LDLVDNFRSTNERVLSCLTNTLERITRLWPSGTLWKGCLPRTNTLLHCVLPLLVVVAPSQASASLTAFLIPQKQQREHIVNGPWGVQNSTSWCPSENSAF